MKSIIFVYFVLSVAVYVRAGYRLTGEEKEDHPEDGKVKKTVSYICFPNVDHGLEWPIGNPRDIAGAIFHGSHCVDSALDYMATHNSQTGSYLHVSHCRNVIKDVLKYFEDNPKYSVPIQICNDLVELATDESCERTEMGTYRCKRWGRPLILLNVMWGKTPLVRKFPDAGSSAADADARVLFDDVAKDSRTVNELYTRISNENVDRVFTKHWKNESLTPEERAYVHKWHHPSISRMNAMGLFCREGDGKKAPLELLRKTLHAMPEDQFADVE